MINSYNSAEVQGIALDVWNGSVSGVQNFVQQTGISYPICLNASATGSEYGVANDYSAVIDQEGIIRYKSAGFNRSAIEAIIDNLLTSSDIRDPNAVTPEEFQLYPSYPNPFNSTTRIAFDLPQSSKVALTVFDLNGRIIRRLEQGKFSAGRHFIRFSADNLASGVYLIELKAGAHRDVRKVILLK